MEKSNEISIDTRECQTVIITRRVTLESRYLDRDIMDHLLNKLRRLTKGECTKEYGHILDVKRVVKIVKHWISSGDSTNVFILKFEANIFRPRKGLEITGIVHAIYIQGIFIRVTGGQMLLVPAPTLTDYTFVEEDSAYVNDCGYEIVAGDEVEIVITDTEFKNQKQTFNCIGSLKELYSP